MRFSTSIVPKRSLLAEDAPRAVEPEAETAPRAAVAQPPWPADVPPDDLDQRVRQIGEW
jgi:hypothetical protein